MHWQIIIPALGLGIISSFHCIGMCGPIALSLPVQHYNAGNKYLGIILYNIGRVVTYSLLGLIFGLFGRGIYLTGGLQLFSILSGIVILSYVLLYAFRYKINRLPNLNRANNLIINVIGKYIKGTSIYTMFFVGILNGLLPCGMVYFALIGAVATGSTTSGVAFMAAYGLGTLPMMFMVTFIGGIIKFSLRSKMKKSMPYFMAVIAILLILRGLNLGIPYISPYFQDNSSKIVHCVGSN